MLLRRMKKTLHDYYASISKGELAIKKGYVLSEEDVAFKRYILDISCKGSTLFKEEHLPILKAYTFPKLETLAEDGLVEWNETGLMLTKQGHYFIRVVCSAFDLYLQKGAQENRIIFSKAI